MKKMLLVVLFAAPLMVATASIACGSGGDKEPTPTPAPTTAAVQQIAVKGIEQGEQYLFDPKTITVKPGTIRVNFTNAGVERPHSFVVKKGETELVNSDRVELGQSKTLEFTITEEGTYQLICTIRGHSDRGMTGSFVVAR